MDYKANLRSSRVVVGLAEVSQMLVDGGYFRAKISTLPEFDKVAGGLAWGILNSRFSIDVEFVENAAIRDKIRISENICRALKAEMRCPHDLEPHQIQGLDYPKIALVLTWLLKRVAAAREENEYFVREHTKAEFRRRFGSRLARLSALNGAGDSLLMAKQRAAAIRAANAAASATSLRRVMRSDPAAAFASVSEHASAVLLEYGFKYQLCDAVMLLQHVDQEILDADAEMQREHARAEDDERREAQMLEALLGNMSEHHEKARMNNAALATVFASADSEKLEKLKATYERRRQELEAQLAAEEAERNALEQQRARLAELQAEAGEVAGQHGGVQAAIEAARGEAAAAHEAVAAKRAELDAEAQRVEEYEQALRADPARASQLETILRLIDEKAAVARRAKKDKTEGKQRVAEVKDECIELAERLQHMQSAEADEQYSAEIAACAASVAELRAELARRDQAAMGVLRQIDEYPSRAELHQYEVRINELNEEVAWKFEDTRQMFNTFNTRAEVAKCLANEKQILGTLKTLFEEALAERGKAAAASRAGLVEQIDRVVAQLHDSVARQKTKKDAEHQDLNRAREGYEELRTKQEAYAQLLARFRDAMALNEALQREIAERGIVLGGADDGEEPADAEKE